MRKLASIQRISNLKPIEGADRIECAEILGWEVVVKKDEFKIGDQCVYVEIDSILPEKAEFEFMRNKKFRVKTIKLRGQVSQGICFPLNILPNIEVEDGMEVTDILGIKKYDPEAQFDIPVKRGRSKLVRFLFKFKIIRRIFLDNRKTNFPDFITKTDETRVQNLTSLIEKIKGQVLSHTEKLEGTSATYALKKGKKKLFRKNENFIVCSRNNVRSHGLKENNFYSKIAYQCEIEKKLSKYIKKQTSCFNSSTINFVYIQGEIIGEKIQGNYYGIKGLDFYVFNVVIGYEKSVRKLSNYAVRKFCNENELQHVPDLGEIEITNIRDLVDNKSVGHSLLNPKLKREGIVIRNDEGDISFKVINPEYLLNND